MLSIKQQRWILKRLLDGQACQVNPAEMTEYRDEFDLLNPLPPPQRRFALLGYYTSQYANGQGLYEEIQNCAAPDGTHYRSYADLEGLFPPINFLWPGWIPNGYLTTLAAKSGTGKSLLALDWAKRVIAGDCCPDGSPLNARSKNVIIVEAENVPQINLERAQKWNIDLEHLYPMLPPDYGSIDLNSLEHKDMLIEMVSHLKPGLIIIDSLGSCTNRGINAKEDIKPILNFLRSFARDAACGLVLIHHIRKRGSNVLPGMPMSVDDVMGSSYILNDSRTLIGMDIIQTGPQVDKNGPRRIQVLKTNFDCYPDPLGCHLVKLPDGTSYMQYDESPAVYRQPSEVDLCAQWLLDLLKELKAPTKPKEIVAIGKEESYSRNTIYRARKLLGNEIIDTAEMRNNPDNKWKLP